MTNQATSRFFPSHDGLRLHALDFRPSRDEARRPVVCLPGLSRSAEDFRALAERLAFASGTPRRVLAFDYRGRGRSAYDPDWRHYDLPTERLDMLTGLADAGIGRAHFVGTSRGGLHVMGMAADHREMIDAVVLNDIGPVLEPEGLSRIKEYLGQPVAPASWTEAIAILQAGSGRHFDGLDGAEWRHFAITTFGADETCLRLRYDPLLARTLDSLDLTRPLPDAWPAFDALRGAPILTVRGANSDLLSPDTLAAMTIRWPGNEALIVDGQGHAPLLADETTISRLDDFLAGADASSSLRDLEA